MSDHSRTHPDHLDETAGRMHQAAGDVEAASGEFDARMAGADYGGGDTAQLIHSLVTGVGTAVGGSPEGAGGKVAQHKHEWADNISRHAANSRANEAAIKASLDDVARARTPEDAAAAAERHLQLRLAAESARRKADPAPDEGGSAPSQLDGLVNRIVDRSRDTAGTHPNNGPDTSRPAHTVTLAWEPGMPKVQFARKALALRRAGDRGALFKAVSPNPDARDDQITKDYKGALINIVQGVHGRTDKTLADETSKLLRSMQPDHVAELQAGGPDTWENLKMLHGPTNNKLGTQIRQQIRTLDPGHPIKVRIKWW
jgi:hypothetical protein